MIFAAISFESSTVMMTAPALAYKSRLRPLNYRAELSLIGGKIQQAQWGWGPSKYSREKQQRKYEPNIGCSPILLF